MLSSGYLKPVWTRFSGYRWTDWLWTGQQLIRLWWGSRSGISATRWLSPCSHNYKTSKKEDRLSPKSFGEVCRGQETSLTGVWECFSGCKLGELFSVGGAFFECLVVTKLVQSNQEARKHLFWANTIIHLLQKLYWHLKPGLFKTKVIVRPSPPHTASLAKSLAY